jgi:hypothetical protein
MLHVLMLYDSAAIAAMAVDELMEAKADCTQVDPIWAHDVSHDW